jgi:hypothetical protein
MRLRETDLKLEMTGLRLACALRGAANYRVGRRTWAELLFSREGCEKEWNVTACRYRRDRERGRMSALLGSGFLSRLTSRYIIPLHGIADHLRPKQSQGPSKESLPRRTR